MTAGAFVEGVQSAGRHLLAADHRLLLVALLAQLGVLACRSLVWRNMLAAAYPDQRIPVRRIAGAYVAGAALNAYLPFRGGDAAKLLLVRLQVAGSHVTTIAATASVVLVIDALVGAALVSGLFALGLAPALPHVPTVDTRYLAAAAVGLPLLGLATLRFRSHAASAARHVALGLRALRCPRLYLRTVAPFQAAAWTFRVVVVLLLLTAFRIDGGVATAALIVVANGMSSAVPIPGGAGVQQALAALVLRGVVPIANAVSFSLGLQVGITLVNTTVGLVALMLLFRSLRPVAAARSALAGS